MKLSEIGEFGLIELIKSHFDAPDGILGIGDDCAIIPMGFGDLLITTDMFIEGVHFLRNDITPREVGCKSIAINLSDIAAMGGTPVASFLSIAFPQDIESEWVDGFIDGYQEISKRYSTSLLGGDTTRSLRDLAITVTVVGRCPHGMAKLRSAACIGDVICVTGTLGDSGAGLKAILEHTPQSVEIKHLIHKHYNPIPKITEGKYLASINGVHAMMDISDGIGSDLRHILNASKVGAEVDITTLPLSNDLRIVAQTYGWNTTELAIGSGEDYELLFTADPQCLAKIEIPYTAIGRIKETSDIKWVTKGQDIKFNNKGFTHF